MTDEDDIDREPYIRVARRLPVMRDSECCAECEACQCADAVGWRA